MSDFLTGSSLPEGNGERLAAPQDYEGAHGAFGPGSEEDNRLQPLTPVGVLSPDPRAAVTAAEQDPFSSLSAHEQAFIAWMKSCSPSANKRRDDWWISLLKVFSSLVSLFSFSLSLALPLSLLSLSLTLSFLFAFLFSSGAAGLRHRVPERPRECGTWGRCTSADHPWSQGLY